MSQVTHERLRPGQVWRHYKGNHYKILALGKHSETGEVLVAYERMEDQHIYFRPITLFFADVEWNGSIVPRFVLVSDH
jgi:hypothetical protein